MIKVYSYPKREDWSTLLQRPAIDNTVLRKKVWAILHDVREERDAALKKYTLQFDGIDITHPGVSKEEINNAETLLPGPLKLAIKTAASNIETFHAARQIKQEVIETMPGVSCWRKEVAIERVGLYIPGGTAPLFSTVLMLGIPARIAGCKNVILCTPPDTNGNIHPAILYAAKITGISKIYKVGGAQAIAAMAYGTETIGRVDKLFGPGNQYVTVAKQLVQLDGISIDIPAGPSELCVLADETANPVFVAADLLSQAEHGPDSQVLMVTTDATLPGNVIEEMLLQLERLPRKDMAAAALLNSKAIVVNNMETALRVVNEYAPEHLLVCCKNEDDIVPQIKNAGSVFLGHYSPESAGDYASGTNHTLPTGGFAKAYSGVSVDSFTKFITYQKITRYGLKNIGPTVELMARAEGLDAHANAISIRLNGNDEN